MSAPQPTSKNRTSLKIHLAYRFLLALNTLNQKRSAFDHTQNHKRSNRVKIAAYASMASVVGPRRAWSRAILWKIRNRCVLTRNKKRVHHITTSLQVKLRKLVPGAETMDPCGLLDETADYIKHLATQVEVMKTLVDLYSTV
ncbi:transcription factor IBH1 [Lactuca sativa]|uniref:transcription factor IBH1 n=1 Tax=Lactuca sativa TaxID=4236 RepID=UPI0022AF08F1|nr:transcription factor IBH1 [Lactuca sativa]